MYLKRSISASLVALSLSVAATTLHAQGIITGSLSGIVQDPTGAVVPNASVSVLDPTKGTPITVQANTAGEFNFPALPIGTYNLTISYSGFTDLKLTGLQIQAGKATGLGVEKLAAGGAVETVEVSTARNLLETVQSQVSTTFATQQVSDLPTGGGFDELALLVPGVVFSMATSILLGHIFPLPDGKPNFHDFTNWEVVAFAVLYYFLVFFFLVGRRRRRLQTRRDASA